MVQSLIRAMLIRAASNSRSGSFDLPGMVSSDTAPAGLWRQLGFSNASHGARQVALSYPVAKGGAPTRLSIHVTRPEQDPVVTQPFELLMREGPEGLTFERADDPCPPESDGAQ